jgi:hypothetical protein
MEFSTLLQIIPILGLVMYMFYMTYFYAFPMLILKILLFYGHIRYRGSFITFRGGKIIVECRRDGKPVVYERPLEVDPLSRYMPMDVCNEFRGLLREIRKGSAVTVEQEALNELSKVQTVEKDS